MRANKSRSTSYHNTHTLLEHVEIFSNLVKDHCSMWDSDY